MINLSQFKIKVKNLFSNEKLPPVLKEDNVYYVFDKYKIVKEQGRFALYRSETFVNYVNKSSTAMSWCLANKSQNWQLAHDLIYYDNQIESKKFDMDIHKQMAKKVDNDDDRNLHYDLYVESLNRLKQFERNLQKSVNLAKYNKIKDFQNESNRIIT